MIFVTVLAFNLFGDGLRDKMCIRDRYQVTIKLKEANITFVNKITQVRMVSPKAMEQGKDYLAKNSAGTGPFKLSDLSLIHISSMTGTRTCTAFFTIPKMQKTSRKP